MGFGRYELTGWEHPIAQCRRDWHVERCVRLLVLKEEKKMERENGGESTRN